MKKQKLFEEKIDIVDTFESADKIIKFCSTNEIVSSAIIKVFKI